ncbi:MAG TPA: hypothetical protein DFS52_06325 [Myxococcales bacterium]|jgi:ABC-type uncharacterized transport system substrate-binding protein|nr:hypothetical protein [Myxococcales bacterium]
MMPAAKKISDGEGAGIEAARLALEIVGGKRPSEVSAAKPRWKLVVNLATAKALGLTARDGHRSAVGVSGRPARAGRPRGENR